MDIVAHTASIAKTNESLKKLLENKMFTQIELDFHLTKDGELVWTHDNVIGGKSITNINYSELREYLTLYDVLEANADEKMIVFEIKDFKLDPVRIELLLKKLETLKTKNNIAIHSFNQDLVRYFLTIKDDFNFYVGLIINLFKTFNYRNGNIEGLENVDFVSLSNELFEWPIVGSDYKIYRELFPNALQYAWSWDTVYSENYKRINNYIQKGVDGISTTNPLFVKSIVDKKIVR